MKYIPFLFIFLLSVAFVSSAEYLSTGDKDYLGGVGIFNANINYNSVGRTISKPSGEAYVADLNNNGTNEILVKDGNTIRLFSHTTLLPIASKTLNLSSAVSNIVIRDIDSDGRKEIIIASLQSERIFILELSGSTLATEVEHDLSTLTALTGSKNNESMIGCTVQNQCGMVWMNTSQVISTTEGLKTMFGTHFNHSTAPSLATFITQRQVSNNAFCFPDIKYLENTDYDGDGIEEFVFTWMDAIGGGSDRLEVQWASVDGGVFSLEQNNDQDTSDNLFTSVDNCERSTAGNLFTSPTAFSAYGTEEQQVFVPLQTQTDNFKIYAFDSDASMINDFPEVFDGDSTLISNVVKGDFFPDTGSVDFCAVGYDEADQLLDIICASLLTGEKNGFVSGTKSYEVNVTLAYNISSASGGVYHTIAHSADHDTEAFTCLDTTCSPQNLDEVVTAYGIYKLRFEGSACDIAGSCDAQEVFANPASQSGALISIDAQNTGVDDLILLTDTNLFYYDALFSDIGSTIDLNSIKINPCVELGAWKTNTSLTISFKVNDGDPVTPDSVGARAILYADSENQQISHSDTMVTSGSTFTFTDLKVNKTTASGVLRLVGNDSGSTDIDSVDIGFSVSDNGIEFGTCTTTGVTPGVQPSNTTATGFITDGVSGNNLQAGTNALSGITSLGGSTLWLLAMAIIAFGIITGGGALSLKATGRIDSGAMLFSLIGALLVDGIIFTIGAINGVFSAGTVFMVFLLLVVIVGIVASRFAFGEGSIAGR